VSPDAQGEGSRAAAAVPPAVRTSVWGLFGESHSTRPAAGACFPASDHGGDAPDGRGRETAHRLPGPAVPRLTRTGCHRRRGPSPRRPVSRRSVTGGTVTGGTVTGGTVTGGTVTRGSKLGGPPASDADRPLPRRRCHHTAAIFATERDHEAGSDGGTTHPAGPLGPGCGSAHRPLASRCQLRRCEFGHRARDSRGPWHDGATTPQCRRRRSPSGTPSPSVAGVMVDAEAPLQAGVA
jgi:hypothetical protein